MQTEFFFSKTYPTKDEQDATFFKKMCETLHRLYPEASKFDLGSLFKDMSSLDLSDCDDCPSIPITIILGKRGQFEFPFVKPLDKIAWPKWDIEYAVEDPYFKDGVNCCAGA